MKFSKLAYKAIYLTSKPPSDYNKEKTGYSVAKGC